MAGSTLPSAPDDVRGRQMGNYEVLCRLSAGGMAEIFLASRKGRAGFHKPVVLKKILPDIQGQQEFVQMFLDEARVTAAFNHPNIAQVFDLDVAGGELFLAMEFVPGATLLEVARACLTAREPMPMGLALATVRDTALALHYAHTFTDTLGEPSPVIHRDVAEKNIMVTYEGVTKLLDFGIAKSLAEVSRTQVGMVKGTSGYMSPEQILGQPLDARSDLFSLGVVLHECLTGARLFPGKAPAAVVNAVLRGPIPEPSRANKSIPPELDAIVLKALSRRREDRYGSTLEFARELERAVSGLIWLPEQSGELLRRLFAERREQTRQVLASAQAATGEPRTPAPALEAKEPVKESAKEPAREVQPPPPPAARLPPITQAPPQSSRGPSSANTDIVPYSPLARPPSAPVAGEERATPPPTPRPASRPSLERGRPLLPPPPRSRMSERGENSEARPDPRRDAEPKTTIVRSRRSMTSESRSAPSEPSSSPRSPAARPTRPGPPAASADGGQRPPPPPPPDDADRNGAAGPADDTTLPVRRMNIPLRDSVDVEAEDADSLTLPHQVISAPARPHRPAYSEEDALLSSGTRALPAVRTSRSRWIALGLLGVLVLAVLLVLMRWDGGLVSSWMMPVHSTAPSAPAPRAPEAARPSPPPALEPASAPPAPAPPATSTGTPSTGAPSTGAPSTGAEPAAPPAPVEASARPTEPEPKPAAEAANTPAGARPRREASPGAPRPSPAPEAGSTPQAPPEPGATMGYLTLTTDLYAQVFLSGRLLGITPLFKLPLPPGRHVLRLIGPNKKALSLPVEITAGEVLSVRKPLNEPASP